MAYFNGSSNRGSPREGDAVVEDVALETQTWFQAELACLGDPRELCLLYILLWLIPSLGAGGKVIQCCGIWLFLLSLPKLDSLFSFASPSGLALSFPRDGVLR